MSAKLKSQEGFGRSNRGGVSMSRARRISDSVDQSTSAGKKWLVTGAVVAAGAAAFVFFGSGTPAEFTTSVAQVAAPVVVTETPVPVTPLPITQVDSAPSAPTVPARQPDIVSEPPDTPGIVRPAAQNRVVIGETASRAASDTCIGGIEANLTTLQAKFAEETLIPWADRQVDVTGLVQRVIDCPTASLEVTGSLELLSLGLADLEVSWHRSDQLLHLTTVTTGTASGRETPVMNADQMKFVLH